jgi:hypothetical protein
MIVEGATRKNAPLSIYMGCIYTKKDHILAGNKIDNPEVMPDI